MLINVLNKANLLVVFILWRILILFPLLIGSFTLPVNLLSPVSFIYKYIESFSSVSSVFIHPWANFDGIHYLNIAEHGYTNQARFFPLFPLILKVASGSIEVSIILVTLILFVAIYFFNKLITLDYPNTLATQSIIYLLLFPTSFFLVSIYSEGLFLLLSILAFYLARKKMWLLSIITAMLLMTTRFVGIAILPALLYEFLLTNGWKSKRIFLFLLAPLGLAIYSYFNFIKWNNLLYFIQAQGELGNNRSVSSIVLFPQTVFRYLKILSTVSIKLHEWRIALLELGSFLFAAVLLYIAWRKKIRTSYLIFALLNFFIATGTGTFSALPRYVIVIFPIFISLALIQNRVLKILYFIFSTLLLFLLLMLFSRGYYIS